VKLLFHFLRAESRIGQHPFYEMKIKLPWLYSMEQLSDGSYLMVASPRPRVSILNVFRDEFLPLILQGGIFALLLSLVVLSFFRAGSQTRCKRWWLRRALLRPLRFSL
jgi:hypothetical protein